MSGERSFVLGQYGEEKTAAFLQLIGWFPRHSNISIPCINKEHRNLKDAEKRSHGEDIIYATQNNFNPKYMDVMHIQVKNQDSYPKKSDLKNKIYKAFHELDNTIQCAKSNQDIVSYIKRARGSLFIPKLNHIGLLVMVSENVQDGEINLLDELEEYDSPRGLESNMLLVDQMQINFILDSIGVAKILYKNAIIQYFCTSTTLSLSQRLEKSTKEMPYSYLTSGCLPIKIQQENKQGLVLFVNDNFTEENFERYINRGLSFLNGWGIFLNIGFRNYEMHKHNKIVADVLTLYKDRLTTYEISAFCSNPIDVVRNQHD